MNNANPDPEYEQLYSKVMSVLNEKQQKMLRRALEDRVELIQNMSEEDLKKYKRVESILQIIRDDLLNNTIENYEERLQHLGDLCEILLALLKSISESWLKTLEELYEERGDSRK